MPLLWLRVAVVFYAMGMVYALLLLSRRSNLLARLALPAVALGMVFHFVSLTETALLERQLTLASLHNSESLLAFVIILFFMIVYARYRTSTPQAAIPDDPPGMLATRARAIPQLLWPQWTIRLMPARGFAPGPFRSAIAACLLLPGHPGRAISTAITALHAHRSALAIGNLESHSLARSGRTASVGCPDHPRLR